MNANEPEAVKAAREWIRTDKQSIRDDIERLGWDNAIEYQMDLMQDRMCMGDCRWHGITLGAMGHAFRLEFQP